MERTLFEMPEAKPAPLVLRADRPVYNYRRIQKGQNLKVNLRDRTGRIVCTIYGGPDMAARIVKCVNDAARRDAAAMREALEKISLLSSAPPPHWKPIAVIVEIGKLADAALAAPPRNCDEYSADELKVKFNSELASELPFANKHEKNLVTITAMGVIDTLLAPATDKKGGAK